MTGVQHQAAVRALVQATDQVHWVREWPKTPTWRDRLHRLRAPDAYLFDQDAAPPLPWVDRPAGAFERSGWRIRAAYLQRDVAFEVEYTVCQACSLGWVEWPYSRPGYERRGLASCALEALRRTYPGLAWHTVGGHINNSEPFWTRAGQGVPGGYTQQDTCEHAVP